MCKIYDISYLMPSKQFIAELIFKKTNVPLHFVK